MVCDPVREMSDTAARPPLDAPASAYSREWIANHLAEERRASSLLGEIREVVFGAQDGLVSTLAVVATVAGASGQAFPVIVAGVASALAGVFSMAAGEYIGSKSQREIFDAQIHEERDEVDGARGRGRGRGRVHARGGRARRGRGRPDRRADGQASRGAPAHDGDPRARIQVDDRHGGVLRGALFMGAAFGLGAAVPVVPFLLLPIAMALPAAVVATGIVLFGIGVVKSRWTHRSALSSGLEVLLLAAFAGVAGYLFGTVLPQLARGRRHHRLTLAPRCNPPTVA